MTESSELTSLAFQIEHVLDRVCAAVEGLDEAQLNWRPPAPDTNSIYVLATHILGNAEAWVLGIACEQPMERDRPAEFLATGPDPSAIVANAHDLARRFKQAFEALPSGDLDLTRRPASASLSSLWGGRSAQPVTARDAILQVIGHGSGHLGHIAITRDWMRATQGS
ncbi:MAG: DinB family protein [Dehalococcoidia bacterium]